eukprot:11189286-Lingulodinium_polyedra.AAC.1
MQAAAPQPSPGTAWLQGAARRLRCASLGARTLQHGSGHWPDCVAPADPKGPAVREPVLQRSPSRGPATAARPRQRRRTEPRAGLGRGPACGAYRGA